MNIKFFKTLLVNFAVIGILLSGCAGQKPKSSSTIKLTLVAYSTPSEAYAKIIPLFVAHWKAQTNQDVVFEQSYAGSGAQSRAVIGGLEADIVALSLEGDIDNIANANLITRDWRANTPNHAIVHTSVVSFAVRKGNPKNIHDWIDLTRPGLEILTPDPKSSGGAQWNVFALYGAALRGKIQGVPANDQTTATQFLVSVLKNVTALDKDARSSITNFETGIGDVAITYENEILLGQQRGQEYDLVIPSSSILIENPVAVVDVYAEKHEVTQVADAFVNFLFTKAAQEIFAQNGFRPVEPEVAAAAQFPAVPDLFTIGEQFGGWAKAKPIYFGDTGIYAQAIAEAQRK